MVEYLNRNEMKVLGALLASSLGHNELIVETGLADKVVRRIRKTLIARGHVGEDRKNWKRGKSLPHFITEHGKTVFLANKDATKMMNQVLDTYSRQNVQGQILSFQNILVFLFSIAYNELYTKGDINAYLEFIKSVELPIREDLNKSKIEQLNELIKTNNFFHAVDARDPYLTLNNLELVGLYHDALLAKEKKHLLTENHRYILEKTGKSTKNYIIKHNTRLMKQLQEDERSWINVKEKLHEELLERENELREQYGHKKFGELFESFYIQVKDSPSWSRNRKIILS